MTNIERDTFVQNVDVRIAQVRVYVHRTHIVYKLLSLTLHPMFDGDDGHIAWGQLGIKERHQRNLAVSLLQ